MLGVFAGCRESYIARSDSLCVLKVRIWKAACAESGFEEGPVAIEEEEGEPEEQEAEGGADEVCGGRG